MTALPSLSAHTGLREVWVGWHDASLTTLPSGFLSSLPSGLTHLYVEGFTLTAAELSTIRGLASLRQLHLGGTGLTSAEVNPLLDVLPDPLTPQEVANLPGGLTAEEYAALAKGMTVLALDGNNLSGVTWSKLARLSGLEILDVTGANLDNNAATDIGNNAPLALQSLWMSYNSLNNVPSLSRFRFLKSLHLDRNNIGETAVGAGTFSGPTSQGLNVRVKDGNPGITSSDAQLESAHAGVGAIFESPAAVTSFSVAKSVVGTAPGNAGYRFSLSCAGPGGTRVHTFTRADGETGYVPVHALGLLTGSVHPDIYRVVGSATCTLTESAVVGATATGLFAGEAITRAGRNVAVVNTFGAAAAPGVTIVTTPPTTAPDYALTVAENAGTAMYTVVLDSLPTADVTVALVKLGDSDAVTLSTPTLTFTTGNWNVAQTVTVTGVNDDIDNAGDARTATITHTANGGDYVNVATALAVTVTDDDTRGVTLATDPPSDPLVITVAPGGMADYTIVLNTEPTANVMMVVTTVPTVATVSLNNLTFTPGDWDMPQTVTVTGVVIGFTEVTQTVTGGDYTGFVTPNIGVTVAVLIDYDVDNDNLIDVANLAQLNAMRWDPNGNFEVAAGDQANYDLAFPDAAAGMGCEATCAGYELTADLDFDTNDDGVTNATGDDYWNAGAGWAPIGGDYNAEFHGNGHTISNLFINRGGTNNVGLFSVLGNEAYVHHVGLIDVNVTGNIQTGALAGSGSGTGARIVAVYVNGGSVTGSYVTGGLIGAFAGTLTAVWTKVDVQSTHDGGDDIARTGGITASLSGSANASYATGSVVTPNYAGSDGRGGIAPKLKPRWDVHFEVLKTTERTPRLVISPLIANRGGTDSAILRYVHFTLALV